MAESYPRFFCRFVLFILLLSTVVCFAQYNSNIQGVVTDPGGAAIRDSVTFAGLARRAGLRVTRTPAGQPPAA